MRAILIVALACAGSAFAHHEEADHAQHHKAEPVVAAVQTEAGAVYGAALPDPMPAVIDIDAAAADPARHAEKPAAFRGRVTEVCQKMGCWVVLTGASGKLARVTMHDHAFGVPKDTQGTAIVFGTLATAKPSAAEAEHLKEDGAKAAADAELRIDATSVLIPKAP